MNEDNMKAQLKVVTSNSKELSPSKICDLIKKDSWDSFQKIVLYDYVVEVTPGTFIPNVTKHFQSRPIIHSPEYVQKKVTESKNGITYREKSTIVFFPEKAEINGKVIESNSYLVIGGIHGVLIDRHLGKLEKNANIINFKIDLNSEVWKVNRLANLLNIPKVEEQALENDAIKLEIHRLMDSRAEQGLDAKPSEEQRKGFFNDYSQLDTAAWSNYVSSHKLGGRREPDKVYTQAELDAFKTQLENMSQYDGYCITDPCAVASWNSAILGRALIACCNNEMKKLLIPLYAKNATQTKALKSGKLEPKIKRQMKDLKEFLNMEDISCIIMKY